MGLNKQEEAKLLPAYGRKRILLLADAYRELSYSFRIMEEESPTGVMDRRELVFQKALRENRKIMEQRLQEMATYMEELAEESLTYSEPNARKVRILKNGLAKHGILLKEIYLIRRKGAMQFVLTMRGQRNADYTTDDIAEVLTEMFGFPLVSAKENLFFVAYEYDTYLYECKGRFEFQTGIASATKENEMVSGDNYLVYDVSGTKKVCMISDGAGSGEEACRDSERVLELAEKYMDTGFAMAEVTDMINSLFVAHGREQNMPTLDACIVDLLEGTVAFRKYGACDSFIRRKESIERIKNTGYPLGFCMREEETEKKEDLSLGLLNDISCDNEQEECVYELNESDCLLMISDGVLECFGDEKSLLKTFTSMEIKDPEEAANYLMQCTIRRCGGHIRDDMTIIVGKLSAAKSRT